MAKARRKMSEKELEERAVCERDGDGIWRWRVKQDDGPARLATESEQEVINGWMRSFREAFAEEWHACIEGIITDPEFRLPMDAKRLEFINWLAGRGPEYRPTVADLAIAAALKNRELYWQSHQKVKRRNEVGEKPAWDSHSRTLEYAGEWKRYNQKAIRAVEILAAFEAAGWPRRVSVGMDVETARTTVRQMNESMISAGVAIRFGTDNADAENQRAARLDRVSVAGVTWQPLTGA